MEAHLSLPITSDHPDFDTVVSLIEPGDTITVRTVGYTEPFSVVCRIPQGHAHLLAGNYVLRDHTGARGGYITEIIDHVGHDENGATR